MRSKVGSKDEEDDDEEFDDLDALGAGQAKTTKPTFKGRWFGVKQKPPGESKKTGDTHSGTGSAQKMPAPLRHAGNKSFAYHGTKYREKDIEGERRSLLKILQDLPKTPSVDGQLSRWWIFENLEQKAGETTDAPVNDKEEGPQEVKLPFLVLHPTSTKRVVWDMIIVLLLLYNIVMIPFRLSFSETQVEDYCTPGPIDHSMLCPGRPWLQMWNHHYWFWFDLGCDAFFVCDIIINFLTTYAFLNPRGDKEFEKSRGIIAYKYFRSWFPLDLVSSIPVEPILYFSGADAYSTGSIFRVLRLMRFAKLLRLWRVGVIFRKIQDMLDVNPALVRMFQLFTIFTILAHWISCFLFWSGTFYSYYQTCDGEDECYCWTDPLPDEDMSHCSPTTWTTSKSFLLPGRGELTIAEMDCEYQYLFTYYWVITTMTTVGYGDIGPVTFYELLAVVVMQIIGVTVFGFMVGNMATLSTMLQGRQGQLKEKLDGIQAFLQSFDVPKYLEKRVVKDMQHIYQTPCINTKRQIVDCVPTELAADVAKELFKRALERVPIFDSIQASSRKALYLRLQPFHVAQNDILINRGEVCRQLIFVLTGSLSIFGFLASVKPGSSDSEGGDALKPTMKETSIRSKQDMLVALFAGCYVGDQCLVVGKDEYEFGVKANSWCTLLSLEARDVIDSLSENDLRHVRLACRLRLERMAALLALSTGIRPGMSLYQSSKLQRGLSRSMSMTYGNHNRSFVKKSLAKDANPNCLEPSQYESGHQSLRDMVQKLDITPRQHEIITGILDVTYTTGKAPDWDLGFDTLRESLDRLVQEYGSLEDAGDWFCFVFLSVVLPSMLLLNLRLHAGHSPTQLNVEVSENTLSERELSDFKPPETFSTLNLGLSDENGRDMQFRLEKQMANVLRRLNKTETLVRQGEKYICEQQTVQNKNFEGKSEEEGHAVEETGASDLLGNTLSPGQVGLISQGREREKGTDRRGGSLTPFNLQEKVESEVVIVEGRDFGLGKHAVIACKQKRQVSKESWEGVL